MAGTFTQLYVQVVFSVRDRLPLINPSWEEELYRYISGLIRRKGEKCITINGIADHIHIFVGMGPDCAISNLVREIKKSSNQFIKENGFVNGPFYWQRGFGAFSYSHRQVGQVFNYIKNQKEHHKRVLYEDEYRALLEKYEIDFDARYIFG